MIFGVDQDIDIRYDGNQLSGTPTHSSAATLSFEFQIENQAQFQQPPPLRAQASYATSKLDGVDQTLWGGLYKSAQAWSAPAYKSSPGPEWNINGLWAVEDTHGWKSSLTQTDASSSGRDIYVGNAYRVTLKVWTTNAVHAQTG